MYSLSTSGSGYTIIHTFGNGSDGSSPSRLIQARNNNIYGTTSNGGTNNLGTIFGFTPGTTLYGDIHNFAGSDGSHPQAGVTQVKDNTLYGITSAGGTNNLGAAFSINGDGASFNFRHSFGLSSDLAGNNVTVSVLSNGFLYGSDSAGGPASDGVVFRINSDGTGYTSLHNFISSDGRYVNPNLVLASNGYLYGTTSLTNYYLGEVFGVGTDGSGFAVLHTFTGGTDGGAPSGGLMQASNGVLYGLTAGYNALGNTQYGTVYGITVSGTGYTILHSFPLSGGTDGAYPESILVQATNGALYGTTLRGGLNNYGAVFGIFPDGSGYGILHNFAGGSDGSNPQGPLIQASNGALYGITGVTGAAGTVFGVFPNGAGYGILNTYPYAFYNYYTDLPTSLIQGANGLLYGANANNGSIYSLTVTGANLNTVYQFPNPVADINDYNPVAPNGNLIPAPDGSFYGVTISSNSYAPVLFHLTGF